ncbi:MAG: hypothetical protein IJ012_03055 [Clostridia bacterium]|nr:hypothetical protein [Clostridia bacterium]
MGITEENIRLFKEALCEGVSNRIDKCIAECEEDIEVTDEHKIAMNRIFREFGFVPYPEVEEK